MIGSFSISIRRFPLFLAPENHIPGGVFGIGIVGLKDPRHVICRLLDKGIRRSPDKLYPIGIFVRYKNRMKPLSYASKPYEKGACDIGSILVRITV